jgi:serine protease
VSGSWRDATSATLSGSSGYTLRVRPTVRGKLTYRVYKRADGDHASGTSRNLSLTVR